MRFVRVAQSFVGRIVQGALGGWLLIEGAAQGSLAGLVAGALDRAAVVAVRQWNYPPLLSTGAARLSC
jgi:hypothetical protein